MSKAIAATSMVKAVQGWTTSRPKQPQELSPWRANRKLTTESIPKNSNVVRLACRDCHPLISQTPRSISSSMTSMRTAGEKRITLLVNEEDAPPSSLSTPANNRNSPTMTSTIREVRRLRAGEFTFGIFPWRVCDTGLVMGLGSAFCRIVAHFAVGGSLTPESPTGNLWPTKLASESTRT